MTILNEIPINLLLSIETTGNHKHLILNFRINVILMDIYVVFYQGSVVIDLPNNAWNGL